MRWVLRLYSTGVRSEPGGRRKGRGERKIEKEEGRGRKGKRERGKEKGEKVKKKSECGKCGTDRGKEERKRGKWRVFGAGGMLRAFVGCGG